MPTRLLLLLFMILPLIGCAPGDPYPVPRTHPTKARVKQESGIKYTFPPTADFDGETWIRVKQFPIANAPGMGYVYASDQRDDYLLFTLYQPSRLMVLGFPLEKQLALATWNPKIGNLQMDGASETYLGSGLVLKGQHANSSKVGKEELYDKDGTLILRGHTTEGRLQGDCTYFYPDGKPMLQGKFSGSTLLEGNGFEPDGTKVELTTPAEVSRFLTERLF
ncbi:hypothetical protein AB1K70_20725 [Bremerella sp. JC770]|uniref:toxin-antitoxin system YwqK family antitoxin n=1 Tax=Bremerella sp. JC770 TaxID=3232137 RepID=UPI0034596644